ncbi:sigma factor-like helix-turn-helix DNA-binding protein [Lentzea sp. BCCO 10_0798]|uniref:Sigma factor-like helix-turn-helix DNA-binding protein n=1 Tax=Lentzea kristufekii TaxID=3095430 RepID=A0ABU4TY98_9PSEU|nr:sigma factor-like helix-turn-helix DNA-binding protein [Lentzea sp. BCCO 10_0798]MDX8053038.1 sigma factor-like helix-turn-helix DNA-binding protein [Lentzea sp. BCCO 10_0798]
MNGRQAARLLGLLPGPQQQVLRLRLVYGLSAEQTAAVLGSTPPVVRLAQHQALEVLRKELAERRGPRRNAVPND